MASTAMASSKLLNKKRKDCCEDMASESNSQERVVESRLPSKKRKGSHDSAAVQCQNGSITSNGTVKASVETSISSSLPHIKSAEAFTLRKGSHGDSSAGLPSGKDSDISNFNDVLALGSSDLGLLQDPSTSTAALELLDNLVSADPKKDEGSENSGATLGGSQQRLLLEAMMTGGTSSQSGNSISRRERFGSWGGGRERLDSLGIGRDRFDMFAGRDQFDLAHAAGRERLDSLATNGGRDRIESWGGMSDLSVGHGGGQIDAVAAVAIANCTLSAHNTEDVASIAKHPAVPSAYHSLSEEVQKAGAVPNRIAVGRDRFNSVNSLSDGSFAGGQLVIDGIDMTHDVQAFVAAAVAQVGDQLAELAEAFENVSGGTEEFSFSKLPQGHDCESESSSVVYPIIGAVLDGGRNNRRPRTWSTSSGKLSVDYDAVAAAVAAASAATQHPDIDIVEGLKDISANAHSTTLAPSRERVKVSKRRTLPMTRNRAAGRNAAFENDQHSCDGLEDNPLGDTRTNPFGYIAPLAALQKTRQKPSVPFKKRAKRTSPEPDRNMLNATVGTPKVSNRSSATMPDLQLSLPLAPPSEYDAKVPGAGQSSQKWDSMLQCLVAFREERRIAETTGLADDDKCTWLWDGNVPTTYKTEDGKALGRWVNNQRSAKNKGTLSSERQQQLVDTGLKWCVMTSNSWEIMLEELKVYAREKSDFGSEWDGNVPTNYQIKIPVAVGPESEDKNLGRWVNRQRSLFHSGKLKKERQLALEEVGLRWSMLATTSWDAMFDVLREYIHERIKETGSWDGNVPALYRTSENPSRGLGRWINRQRSAHARGKLTNDLFEKLNEVGLKWSVHDRVLPRSEGDDENVATPEAMKSNKDKICGNNEFPDHVTSTLEVNS